LANAEHIFAEMEIRSIHWWKKLENCDIIVVIRIMVFIGNMDFILFFYNFLQQNLYA
jgi:hypothetical protein